MTQPKRKIVVPKLEGNVPGAGFPRVGGAQSDGQREKQRSLMRRAQRSPAHAQQLLAGPGGPVSLQTDYGLFQRAARKHQTQFKRDQPHVQKLLSMRGHNQFLEHSKLQQRGGGFSRVVRRVLKLSTQPHKALRAAMQRAGLGQSGPMGRGQKPTVSVSVAEEEEPPERRDVPVVVQRKPRGRAQKGVRRTVQQRLEQLHGPPKQVTVQPMRSPPQPVSAAGAPKGPVFLR